MAENLESDYWCVYNECSQDVLELKSSLWFDPWPTPLAGNDTGAMTSLFDEVDQLHNEDESLALDLVSPLAMSPRVIDDLPDELLEVENTVISEDCDDICNTVSPFSELTNECTTVLYEQSAGVNLSSCDYDAGYSETMSSKSLQVTAQTTDSLSNDCIPTRHAGDDDDSSQGSDHQCENDNNSVGNMSIDNFNICQNQGSFRCLLSQRLSVQRDAVDDDYSGDDDDYLMACDTNRGRGRPRKTSSVEDEVTTTSRRSACSELNKNALNARLNRQKKKAYIASLEQKQLRLSRENARLKSAVTSLASACDSLEDEVKYLKAVLANDSALAHLIGKIGGGAMSGVKLTSHFDAGVTRKRHHSIESDHDYVPASKFHIQAESEPLVGGVCLHVQQSRMSLEFCERCSRISGGS